MLRCIVVSGVETTLLEVCVLLEIISIVEPDLVPGGLVECVSVGVRFKHLLWFAFRGVFLVICFSRLRDSGLIIAQLVPEWIFVGGVT